MLIRHCPPGWLLHWYKVDRRRYADIYIRAHHPVEDLSADHRDPHQWRFYIALAAALEGQGRLLLAGNPTN
jgi:hypothetical protein